MARNAVTVENWVWIGIGTPDGAGAIGGGTWNLERDYQRSDLPEQLQLGMIIGVYSGPADLHAEFDEITFRTPQTLADCSS
jgi:hypothetical protein